MSTRFAKIVGTLGPSSSEEFEIRQLVLAGLDVVRLNFSHGTHDDHAKRIALIRKLSDEIGKPLTILMDLQGPKLRIGNLPENSLDLVAGQDVALSSLDENAEDIDSQVTYIPFDVPKLHEALKPGDHILLDDGQLEFEVTKLQGKAIYAKVILGGILSSHKGVNLPNANLNIPVLTAKDLEDLKFGLASGIDMVAISFVKDEKDIIFVREKINNTSNSVEYIPIIAKIERPQAMDNLEEIIKVADGVMVARGDLGVEMSPALVPVAQKEIIRLANRHAKIVITATQMLDSMIHNPRPTRAEAADVANAIFDGTDAVMLSGETAAGKYPVQSVSMMDGIVREAESHFFEWGHLDDVTLAFQNDDAISISRAARELAHDRDVAAIIVFTQSGRTAQWMSKAKPHVPIYAFTPDEKTYHKLGILWGVTPLLVPHADTLETMITHVETAITTSTTLKSGDQVVVISGFPVGEFRKPNLALLYTIKG